MYSSYKNDINKANIVSFPNRDSIIQMELIKQNNKTTSNNSFQNTSNDNNASFQQDSKHMLLIGALLSLSENTRMNDCLLPVLTGIIMSL